MKKIVFLLLIISFISISGYSQIDDLKKKSDEKQENSDNKDGDNQGSGFTPSDAYCLSSCLQTSFNLMFSFVGQALINHHVQIMNNISDPFKFSVDFRPTIAYGFHFNKERFRVYDYINGLPQIHARWGVLSTDLRYNLLIDFYDFSAEAFQSWEWNIFQINIQPAEEHVITLGTGIAFDSYSKIIYNEHLIGYKYKTLNQMFTGEATARLATDYKIVPNPEDAIFFTEINISGGAKFMTMNHLFGYANLGFVYQNYFLSHQIMSVQAGLTFNIH